MTQRRNYRTQADRWFSKWIRNRDGACRECGTVANLQCAHIISRSYKSIRTSASNAVTLCREHHVYFTHRPLEWEEWVVAEFGRDYYESLRKQALDHDLAKKVDWSFEAAYWKGLCEQEGIK